MKNLNGNTEDEQRGNTLVISEVTNHQLSGTG